MSNLSYGISYMGSKNGIVDFIYKNLPSGNRLVDLFGGGGAITHYFILKQQGTFLKKYNEFYYNDLNKSIVDLFTDCVNDRIRSNKYFRKWITREDFETLKEYEPLIKYCWSFGNSGETYLYNKCLEDWRKALFYYKVYNDFSYFKRFNLEIDDLKDIEKCKINYTKYYVENVLHIKDYDYNNLEQNLKDRLEINREELRQYLIDGLKKSGYSQAYVGRTLNLGYMTRHYFAKSQWCFPTEENYNKLKELLNLDKEYKDIMKVDNSIFTILQSFNNDVKRLYNRENSNRLLNLARLKDIDEKLTIDNISYKDYVYKSGDVVYCDPPYENTHEYNDEGFDHQEFYNWVATRPYKVFFSSYEISDNRFKIVDKVEKYKLFNSLGLEDGRPKTIEYLYSN